MAKKEIKYTSQQASLDFFNNCSSNSISIPKDLNTSGTPFHLNPNYSCSCKKDHSFFSDPYSWKKNEEPDDCSRGDIKKAYCLGRWY